LHGLGHGDICPSTTLPLKPRSRARALIAVNAASENYECRL